MSSSTLDANIGLDLYIVEGANPGFVYQVEAFDPEDTNQSIPLSVSLLVKQEGLLQAAFDPGAWSLGLWWGAVGAVIWEDCAVHSIEYRGCWNG